MLFAEVNTEEEAERQVENMFRVLDFDPAVEAAEIRGKNATIEEQRRNEPTTKPTGGAGVTTTTRPKASRGIFDIARGDE